MKGINFVAGVIVGSLLFTAPFSSAFSDKQVPPSTNNQNIKTEQINYEAQNGFNNKLENNNNISNVENKIEVQSVDVYFDGELAQLSKHPGFFYTSDNRYVPTAITYDSTTYVPLEYLSANLKYQIYQENNKIFINSPQLIENEIQSNEPVEEIETIKESETPDKIDFYLRDISLLDIFPYENINQAINKVKNSNTIVDGPHDGTYYLTDSEYTDTSYFLAIDVNEQNNVIGVSYDNFERNVGLEGSLKTGSLGMRIGSTVADVFGKYGDESIAEVTIQEPNPDGTRFIVIEYNFGSNDIYGDLTFIAKVNKDDEIWRGKVYGIEYKLK